MLEIAKDQAFSTLSTIVVSHVRIVSSSAPPPWALTVDPMADSATVLVAALSSRITSDTSCSTSSSNPMKRARGRHDLGMRLIASLIICSPESSSRATRAVEVLRVITTLQSCPSAPRCRHRPFVPHQGLRILVLSSCCAGTDPAGLHSLSILPPPLCTYRGLGSASSSHIGAVPSDPRRKLHTDGTISTQDHGNDIQSRGRLTYIVCQTTSSSTSNISRGPQFNQHRSCRYERTSPGRDFHCNFNCNGAEDHLDRFVQRAPVVACILGCEASPSQPPISASGIDSAPFPRATDPS